MQRRRQRGGRWRRNAAAAAASPRAHATLRSKDAEVKIPALSAACKQARNAKTAKCSKQPIAGQKIRQRPPARVNTPEQGESSKNIKGKKGRDKGQAKSSARTANTAPPPAGTKAKPPRSKPTNKKNDETR